MITPLAFTDSAAFIAGQQYERRRAGEILRHRRSIILHSDIPPKQRRTLLDEIDSCINALEEVGP